MAQFKGIGQGGEEIIIEAPTAGEALQDSRLASNSGVIAINEPTDVEPQESNTISSDTLQDEPEFSLPSPATTDVGEDIGAIAEITTKRREAAETRRDEAKEDFSDTLKDILEVQQSRGRLEEQEGIGDLSKELDEVDAQIEAKQLALRRQTERIQTQAGLTKGQANARIQEVTRKANMELADLSIIRNAADRKLTTAQALVDRKIDLALEPLKTKLQFHQKIWDERRNLFNKAEQEEFNQLIKREERELKEEGERLKTLENTKLDLLNQAVANGAPISILTAIQMAETPEEAITSAGSFGQAGEDFTGTGAAFREFAAIHGRAPTQQELFDFTRQRAGRSGGGGITDTPEEPLSINQIEQFRRSFGWTPPLGFTMSQLQQYMADNPNATPEELEAGARQAAETVEGATEEQTPTDITPDEAITTIMDTVTDSQLKALKKKADAAGISSFFKHKTTDVKNYLNSIKDQIQEALNASYTVEEILEFLAI